MSLFRPEATAAYVGSETRGGLSRVAPPSTLIILAILTALLGTAIVLGAVSKVSLHAHGRGITVASAPPSISRASVAGVVTSVVHPGDPVKAGDVLARIETGADDDAVTRCKADHKRAETRLAEVNAQIAGSGSTDVLSVALAANATALEARLAQLEERCERLTQLARGATIVSLISGSVASVRVHHGDRVRPGDALIAVYDRTTQVVGHVQLSEEDRNVVKPGHEVRIRFDAMSGHDAITGNGKVLRVLDSSAKPETEEEKPKTEESTTGVLVEVAITPAMQAGMRFTAEVLSERRSLLSILVHRRDTDGD